MGGAADATKTSCATAPFNRRLETPGYGFESDEAATVSDGSGIYLVAEDRAIGSRETYLTRLSCDGETATRLAELDIVTGFDRLRRFLAQSPEDVLVLEDRSRITAYSKIDGSSRVLVDGQNNAFDLLARTDTEDRTTLSWIAGTSLRLKVGDGETRTLVAALPSNDFGTVCRTEALLPAHTLLICDGTDLLSVPHNGGETAVLTPFRAADNTRISAPSVLDGTVYFAAAAPCERDICDQRDTSLWSVSYVNGAWGSAREIRNVAAEFETVDRMVVAGERLLMAGTPQGRVSTAQSTVRSYPLDALSSGKANVLAAEGQLGNADANNAHIILRDTVIQSPLVEARGEGLPVEPIAERPSCPRDASTFTSRETLGEEISSIAIAVDESGVFTLPSTAATGTAEFPLARRGCDGGSRTALRSFEAQRAEAFRPNSVARGDGETYVVEGGERLYRLPDGSEAELLSGSESIAIDLRVAGDTLYWMAEPGLRSFRNGEASTLARLPFGPFAPECRIAGLDNQEIFVVCDRDDIRAVRRDNGAVRTLWEEAGKPRVNAILRGETLWMVRQICPEGRTCTENFQRRPEIWRMPADGSRDPEPFRDISLVYEGLPSLVGFTDTHLVLNGSPINQRSSTDNTVGTVRLDGAGDVGTVSITRQAVAVDEKRIYLVISESNGYTVSAVEP